MNHGFKPRGIHPSSKYDPGMETEAWKNRLYTATTLTFQGGYYFIVDCWHHRILFSRDLDSSLANWEVLDDDIAGPHSIVFGEGFWVAEDTGRNALRVYSQPGHRFTREKSVKLPLLLRQVIGGSGVRPHRVLFDDVRRGFWVIGSGDQTLLRLSRRALGGGLRIAKKYFLPEMQNEYCRSISIRDHLIYVVSDRRVASFSLQNDLEFVKEWALPPGITGSNDLYFLEQGGAFMTFTPKKIVFFEDLESLEEGNVIDLTEAIGSGTPYYISSILGKLCVPEITESTRIAFYEWVNPILSMNEEFMWFGLPNEDDAARKKDLPL